MVKVGGLIYKVVFKKLEKILTCFFGEVNVEVRQRVFGEQFVVMTDEYEFHCYSALDKKWQGEEENFIVDILYSGELQKAIQLVEKLVMVLKRENFVYDLEYRKIDSKGFAISEEVQLRHPTYMDFMKTHYEV